MPQHFMLQNVFKQKKKRKSINRNDAIYILKYIPSMYKDFMISKSMIFFNEIDLLRPQFAGFMKTIHHHKKTVSSTIGKHAVFNWYQT